MGLLSGIMKAASAAIDVVKTPIAMGTDMIEGFENDRTARQIEKAAEKAQRAIDETLDD
jgi:hypothetical protein